MKEVTIKLYEYGELSDEAKERAHRTYAEGYYDPMLQAHLGNLLMEELDEREIKYEASSINVMYSLGNSQGDGLMFEGSLVWRGHDVSIKHADNHYYHSRTASFDYEDANGEDSLKERERDAFESIYRSICKEIERRGYEEIEYQQSEEAFIEACDANEWTFEENGTMRNS